MRILISLLCLLASICLAIDSKPAITKSYNSILPIVKIDLLDQDMSRDERIHAKIEVIWNNNPPNKLSDKPSGKNGYSGWIDIKWRGMRSFNWPLKPYNFKLVSEDREKMEVPFFSFPAGDSFNMKGPGPRDHGASLYFMGDSIGFDMWRELGRWAPRTQFCVLFIKWNHTTTLQEEYQGVYLLEEAIDRGENRIPIDKWDAKDPNRGYFISRGGVDKDEDVYFRPKDCRYSMAIKYPNKEVPKKHIEFIEKYWEPICAGKKWESHLDIPSFVDNFLLLQFVLADDTLKWNSRFWKNTDGPIVAGPVWDLDLGFNYKKGSDFWLEKYEKTEEYHNLFGKYEGFNEMLVQRWVDLRNYEWTTEKILKLAKQRFDSIQREMELERLSKSSFEDHKEGVLKYIEDRFEWMDAHIGKCCPI